MVDGKGWEFNERKPNETAQKQLRLGREGGACFGFYSEM